jgi:hypothetical protein
LRLVDLLNFALARDESFAGDVQRLRSLPSVLVELLDLLLVSLSVVLLDEGLDVLGSLGDVLILLWLGWGNVGIWRLIEHSVLRRRVR